MNGPFDQTTIGLRERPVSSDHNRQFSQAYLTLRETLRLMLSRRASNSSSAMANVGGFLSNGFRVVPSSPAAMSVQVTPGLGFLFDATDLPNNIGSTDLEQINDLSAYKPIPLNASQTFFVPGAPGSPNSRIDIIEARCDRRLEDFELRRQLDPGTGEFDDHSFFKTLAYGLDGRTGVVTSPASSTAGLSYKIGVAGNPGAVPATTAGYMKIAEINVPNGTTSITGNAIVDQRAVLSPGGVARASISWRQQWNGGSPIVTVGWVVAPPGVEFGILPFGAAPVQNGRLFMIGGGFSGVVSNIQAMTNNGASLIHSFQRAGFGGGSTTGPVSSNPSDFLAQADLNTAGLQVGIRQAAFGVEYRAADDSADFAGATVEDVIWQAQLDVIY